MGIHIKGSDLVDLTELLNEETGRRMLPSAVSLDGVAPFKFNLNLNGGRECVPKPTFPPLSNEDCET